ncbi:MAG: SPOR domain-containing protein, partial [Thermodesulfobacteriota bacterium]
NLAALPKIEPGGKYTVQIGSFQEEDKAKQVVESLRSKGYPVFINEVAIAGQGTRYRARVGTFKTREDARLYADNLKNREPDSVKLVYVTINN